MTLQKFAIIVAGGSGSRMGSDIPKQFLPIHQRPVVWYTVEAFLEAFDDVQVILVVASAHLATANELIKKYSWHDRVRLTTGGESRFLSVKQGLQMVTGPSVVFVHDGVRCLLTTSLVRRCYAAAVEFGSAIPCIESRDSMRVVTKDGNHSLARQSVRLIQTPQTFLSDWILPAYAAAADENFTDDASVVEKMNRRLHLIEGEINNIKITTPMDLLVAAQLLSRPQENR